ncbi:ketosynthase chain-length factor [Streptomyces thermoviolaceus]|uniref:Ketosynthase chain-length factor n=1 Tax=Streptomyces thermoviolaceus subsp. thermoviolaceus TaxID=66860 RepID=A0ABX0YUW9_STRTL|nr:ketosynthase chain-length factor [Streptomyces thermoviolaceus]MCM3264788.1 ketosynthase chain-length factor [Streptomyces thermoviolaceus]NJP16376.1 ketosynthase chain-length factor [Streptomyces thermoviolaceus subsp. thermoviolaceus]WTD48900.1 ketosynthase chain-length factor [Streptomyces thermoviolaceus]GHB08713.1 actinorhodin polyketide putative beta-ketoacyl synthase 2 [Streptomyces thermoviolaceus subsp. thermoviolaceus]
MSARSTAPRVAITGVGVIAPGGTGTEAYWQSLLSGVSSIRELTRFDASRYPCRLAGQIDDDFDTAGLVPARLLPQTDISTRYALVAGHHALSDAGVASGPEAAPDYAMGVVTSTAQGGFDFTHREFRKLWHQGPEYVSVYESFAWFYAVNTGQLSIRHTLRGPSAALVAEQAGGLDAIGHARRTVRRGTPLMLTGGIDSAFDPWGWSSQLAGGLVSTVDDPERAYLPFDDDASGYVPGEGGAMFVLEDLDAALRRGAERIWGEVAGYAATFDPAPGTGRPPGLARAAELALADAGLAPDDVSVVFADGAGVPRLDRAEAAALTALFGPRGVPVTAPKALTGRLCAGGGPADLAAAVLALRDQVVPATGRTVNVPEEYALDLVTGEPREAALSTALVLARGRHGFNSALVITLPRP